MEEYSTVNTISDTLKEHYILGCQMTGRYGFPVLPPVNAKLTGMKPVPFSGARNEKKPKGCICHFFIDDIRFERLWNNADKYYDILKNFKYVCSPDFSMYSDMPLALQVYQIYRSRALAWYMTVNGMDVIPAVTWGFPDSYEFCFDGLPVNSTLAVSTNGCFTETGKECYREGFREMCCRLNPKNVLVIGKEIPVDVDVDIVYMDSYGQAMAKRMKEVPNWGGGAEAKGIHQM